MTCHVVYYKDITKGALYLGMFVRRIGSTLVSSKFLTNCQQVKLYKVSYIELR